VYVEISYHQEGDPKSSEEGIWGNRVNSVVPCVCGVGFYYPEGVKVGPEKRFLGRDVEGEDVIHPLEFWEYRIRGKKRYMHVGCHPGLPDRGEEGLKAIEGGKVSLAHGRFLKKN